LVAAAGGRVSEFEDGPLDVQRGAVIASNGLVHDALVNTIRETRAGRPVPLRGV
jgi:fructose-1,6-bisphosphatase/inositol monophosphatase family enzyme